MTTSVHLFAKDLRRFAPWIGLWLAVLALSVAPAFLQDGTLWLRWIVETLVPPVRLLVFVVLIALVVHEDPPQGTSAFWLSRPITPTALYGGKLLFVLLILVLPVSVAEIALLATVDVGANYVWLGAAEIVVDWTRWGVWLLLLASLARGLAGTIPVVLGFGVILFVLPTALVLAVGSIERWWAGVDGPIVKGLAREIMASGFTPRWHVWPGTTASATFVAWLASIAIALAVSVLRYRTRRHVATWAMVVVSVIVVDLGRNFWRWDLLGYDGATLPVARSSELDTVLLVDPTARKVEGMWNEILESTPRRPYLVDAVVEGLPGGLAGEVADLTRSIAFPGGRPVHVTSLRAGLEAIRWNPDAVESLLGGVRIVNLDAPSTSPEVAGPTVGSGIVIMSPSGLTAAGTLSANVRVIAREYESTTLPLGAGARAQAGLASVVVESAQCRKEQCVISVRETNVRLLLAPPAQRHAEIWMMRFQPDVLYVLRNETRGEAVVPAQPQMGFAFPGRRRVESTTFMATYETELDGAASSRLDAAWLADAELVRIERRSVAESTERIEVRKFALVDSGARRAEPQRFALHMGAPRRAANAVGEPVPPPAALTTTTSLPRVNVVGTGSPDRQRPRGTQAFTLSDDLLRLLCADAEDQVVCHDVAGPGVEMTFRFGPEQATLPALNIDVARFPTLHVVDYRRFDRFALAFELIAMDGQAPPPGVSRFVIASPTINQGYTPPPLTLDDDVRGPLIGSTRLKATPQALGISIHDGTADATGRNRRQPWPYQGTATVRVAPAADAIVLEVPVDDILPDVTLAPDFTLAEDTLLELCGDSPYVETRDVDGPGVEVAFDVPYPERRIHCTLAAGRLGGLRGLDPGVFGRFQLRFQFVSIDGDAGPSRAPDVADGLGVSAQPNAAHLPTYATLVAHDGSSPWRSAGASLASPLEELSVEFVPGEVDAQGKRISSQLPGQRRVTVRIAPAENATPLSIHRERTDEVGDHNAAFTLSDEALMTLCSNVLAGDEIPTVTDVPGPGVELTMIVHDQIIDCSPSREMMQRLTSEIPEGVHRGEIQLTLVEIDGQPPDGHRILWPRLGIKPGSGGQTTLEGPLGASALSSTESGTLSGRLESIELSFVPGLEGKKFDRENPGWPVPATVRIRLAPPAGAPVLPVGGSPDREVDRTRAVAGN